MTRLRQVLVFEYLLADSTAWLSASESMKNEAAAMLTALTADIRGLHNTLPVVMLSSAAAGMLRESGKLDADTPVIVPEQGPGEWVASPTVRPESFAASLIIAPECGGILTSLLRQLQTGDWQCVPSVNVSSAVAELFSDKLQTFRWLMSHGIPSPDTRPLTNDTKSVWLEDCIQTEPPTERTLSRFVVKPRDGAGSDQVLLCRQNELRFKALSAFDSPEHSWIAQPYAEGTACSIGLIGGWTERPPLLLPPAVQHVRECDNQLKYYGGKIPLGDPWAAAVLETASRLAEAFGPFRGYLGIDLVATTDQTGSVTAHVIEVNPRLCTSYTGYRSLLKNNLARLMLAPSNQDRLEFRAEEVEFDTSRLF